MSTPTIRDALERLLAVCDTDESNVLDIDPDQLLCAITDARAALKTEPVGEGASERIVSIAKAVQECAFAHESDARLIGNVCAEDVADLCDAVIDRWGHPAALPAPKPGEVGELIQCLQIRAASLGAEGANLRQRGDAVYFTRAATLLQQQAAPAPAVVPVASEWEDGFMSGVCAALATVTVHEENVIWREIVGSVGVDNALNYAANVNPEDWDLAGFSEYAQPELGKGKPLPLPQAGEGES